MNNFISTGVNDVTNDNRNDIKLLRTGDNDQLSIADVNEKRHGMSIVLTVC